MEIAIVARAKQGYIYRYMITRNMSAKQLAGEIGIDQVTIGRIINFKWLPPKRRKKNDITEKLEKYFKIPIDILFPEEFTQEIAQKIGRKFVKFEEVDILQLESIPERYLPYIEQNELIDEESIDEAIKKALSSLTKREEDVIRRRFGIDMDESQTLEAISIHLGVSRNRIHQIEAKALRKLQHKTRRQFLEGFVE